VSRRTSARVVRWAAVAALTVAAFEACSNSTDSVSTGITGPPVLAFATPPTDSTALGCDNTLVVHLTVNTPNWTFKPPYNCGTEPQCGTVRVSLLAAAADGSPLVGSPLITQAAATPDVQIDLTPLVDPKTPDGPSLSQVAFIKAELIGDSLLPYPPSVGAMTIVTTPISLTSLGCSSEAGAGGAAGAASSSAGAAGATTSEGGASGSGGSSAAGSGGLGGSGNEAGADGVDTTAGGATP
jgi:hypothetical protein